MMTLSERRDKKLAYQRIYRFKNKEILNAKHRAYKRRTKYIWTPSESAKVRKYERLKKWRSNNREKCALWDKENRLRDIEKARAYGRERYRIHAVAVKEKAKARSRRLKMEVISAYGGSCTCCGENEFRFLTVEHLNHDGKLHRNAVGSGNGVYLDIKNHGFPKDRYTILCMNCNFSERNGEKCPHKVVVDRILFGVAA